MKTNQDHEEQMGGSLARTHGLNVLRLEGSFYDMGRQHGALLADEVARGPIPYYRDFVARALGKSRLGPLAPLVHAGIRRLVGGRVARALPSYATETIRGLADGSGLPYQSLLEGCTMPDSLLWVVARLIRLSGVRPAVAHRLELGLGCTSAIAWGDATPDGRLLHARNLDYHGVAAWPATATVAFHNPERGLRYVSATAAGVIMGGHTAMNEAGLTLAVHQHMFTDRTTLGGTPIGVTGDRIMREARTLDEAEAILAAQTPIGCWTYLCTDGNTREVLCWEENPQRNAPRRIQRREGGTFGYANVYLDPELGATEADWYGSYWRHNKGRHRRVNQLLMSQAGALDATAMAGIIGHPGDPDCRVRDSIAMVMTVGSVVFRPEDGVLWLGTGQAPTSQGTFVPFSLDAQGHAPEHGALEVPGGDGADAFEHFRRAYVAYVDSGDVSAARRELDEARALAPEQALYHALAGILSVQDRDPAAAEAALTAAIDHGHPDPERVAGFHLWRGRARDLDADRAGAMSDYETTLGLAADPPVHRAARRGKKSRFSRRAAGKVVADMGLADVITP